MVHTWRRVVAIALVAAVLTVAAGGCSEGDGPGSSARPDGSDTSGDASEGAGGEGGEWPTFGYDLANTRANPDEAIITAETAGSLEEVWHLEDLGGVSSTPSVVDGIVYFGDWNGTVHAVSAEAGTEIWTAEVGSAVMSSVTITDDAAYVTDNRVLRRLDLATGEELWQAEAGEHPITISPAAPVVVGDLVIQAVAGGELMVPLEDYSFRGRMTAYDADSGTEVWRRYFTEDDETSGAGVGLWSTPSYDEELGLLYVGTGNTYEPPASPLSDSLVALDAETGEIAWSTQFTFPDVWSTGNAGGLDADVGAGPNLWEADGRKLVGAGDKRGVYHALDRETGDVVWETPMTPGSLLGGVIGTSAHHDGRLFVGSNIGNAENNAPTGNTRILALDDTTGAIEWEQDLPGAAYAPITVVSGVVLAATTAGVMVALAEDDGRELWRYQALDQVGGGASVVDGTLYWGYGFSLLGTGTGVGGLLAFRPGGADASGGEGGGEGGGGGPGGAESLGARVYRESCSACHGTRGQGGVGRELIGVAERFTEEEHRAIVVEGKGTQMPAFDEALTDEEIEAVIRHERDDLGS